MRSRRYRYLALLAAVSVLVGVVVVVRMLWMPPFYDRARFHFWRNAEAMSALAQTLNSETRFDWIAYVDGEVEASAPNAFRVPLTEEEASNYERLFVESEIPAIRRAEWGISAEVAHMERFGKQFVLIYMFDAPAHPVQPVCKAQYWFTDEGACRITLSDRWALLYIWLSSGNGGGAHTHATDMSKASRPLQRKGRAAFAMPLMRALGGAKPTCETLRRC